MEPNQNFLEDADVQSELAFHEGSAAAHQGNMEAAEAAFVKALELCPDNLNASNALAQIRNLKK